MELIENLKRLFSGVVKCFRLHSGNSFALFLN